MRADQLHLDQILFLDAETGMITHVALLKQDAPFEEVQLGGDAPTLYRPRLACWDELFEPVQVSMPLLREIVAEFEGSVLAQHQALTIYDVDELFANPEEVNDALISNVLDELAVSREHFNQSAALRWIESEGLRVFSRMQELEGHGGGLDGAPLEELPERWVDAGADASTLALLNSAFSAPVGAG